MNRSSFDLFTVHMTSGWSGSRWVACLASMEHLRAADMLCTWSRPGSKN